MLREYIVLFALLAGAWSCAVPPQFWCDTVQIAKDCQVLEQCEKFVWSKDTLGSSASPVALTLYYESLCPDCKEFFTQQLAPTLSKVAGIMDLQLVPYGNAMEKQDGDKWVFKCQHGDEECLGNIIETCCLALNKFNVSQAFPLIACMEASDARPEDSAKTCGKKLGVDIGPIMSCAQSDVGNQLEHKMALLTEKLDPPHQYVPWITLNGVHTEQIQEAAQSNLLKLICDSYQGDKPSVCPRKAHLSGRPLFKNSNLL